MWRHYLGGLTTEVSPYAAPARASDLRGLPPAYVSVMEFDPLRDEAIAYAARLLAAGVSVELHVLPGTFHGSHIVATAQISRRAAAEEITVFLRALGLDGIGSPDDELARGSDAQHGLACIEETRRRGGGQRSDRELAGGGVRPPAASRISGESKSMSAAVRSARLALPANWCW